MSGTALTNQLVPFRCGHCPEGGRFLHAFLPDGVAAHKWRPEHLVDVPALVQELGLSHRRDELFLWIPSWLEPAIKLYMANSIESGISLKEYLTRFVATIDGI